MYIRTCLKISLALTLFCGSNAMALGLGELEVESSLAAPFQARVGLDNRNSEVFLGTDQVKINLESNLFGNRASKTAPRLRYRFEKLNSQAPELVLYTQLPVMNPLFTINVTVDWSEGRLSRVYDVILDPAEYDLGGPSSERESSVADESNPAEEDAGVSAANVPAQQESTDTGSEPEAQEPAPEAGAITNFGPTENGISLWRVARRVRSDDGDLSLYQWMHGLWKINGEAFLRSNMHLLKVGVVLEVPTDALIAEVSPRQAYRIYAKHLAELERGSEVLEDKALSVANEPGTAKPLSSSDIAETSITVKSDSTGPTEAESEVGSEPQSVSTTPPVAQQASEIMEPGIIEPDLPEAVMTAMGSEPKTASLVSAGSEGPLATDSPLVDSQSPSSPVSEMAEESNAIDTGAASLTPVSTDTGGVEVETGITGLIGGIDRFIGAGMNTVNGIVRSNSGWTNIALGSLLTILVLVLWRIFRPASRQDAPADSAVVARNSKPQELKRNGPLLEQGRLNNSSAVNQGAAELDNFQTDQEIHHQLWEIKTLLGYGRNTVARGKLKRAIDQYPENHQFKLLLADLYVQTSDIEELEALVEELALCDGQMDSEQLAHFHAVEAQLHKHQTASSLVSKNLDVEEPIGSDPLAECPGKVSEQSPENTRETMQQQAAPLNSDAEETLELLFFKESDAQKSAGDDWQSGDVVPADAMQDDDPGADDILNDLLECDLALTTSDEGLANPVTGAGDASGESVEDGLLDLPDSLELFESMPPEGTDQPEADLPDFEEIALSGDEDGQSVIEDESEVENPSEESLDAESAAQKDQPRVLSFPDPERVNYENDLKAFESEVMLTLQSMRDQMQHLNERLFRQERENHELKKQLHEDARQHHDDNKKQA